MKILLINPSGGQEEEYGALSKAAPELPQLGIAAVATALSNNGDTVKIIDYNLEQLTSNLLLHIIAVEKYDIVGFSVYITSMVKTQQLAKKIKAAHPDIQIWVGGPQATLQPDYFATDYIDYVFLGEADHAVLEVIKQIKTGRRDRPIRGVINNKMSRGRLGLDINLIEDLDRLPLIDLDNFYDLSKYHPPIYIRGQKVINLVGVRGCPFQCTFCAAAEINGRKLRKMSPERFVDYIEKYHYKGYDSFMIYDDTFTVDRRRAVEIAKEIIRRKIKISWNVWSRVDCLDYDTLRYMREAGCYLMVFGCETMNNPTLRLLKKGFTAEQSLVGIEMVKNAGMLTVSSFMVGLPTETEADILHTIATVNSSSLDIAVFPIFEPYAGTPIYEVCKREGRWIKDSRYRNELLVEQEEIWEPHTLSRADVVRLAQHAFRSFYIRIDFLKSFSKIFPNLPLDRKIRLIRSGLDYFFFSKISTHVKRYRRGSRYR